MCLAPDSGKYASFITVTSSVIHSTCHNILEGVCYVGKFKPVVSWYITVTVGPHVWFWAGL